ncbi:MAG: DUF58 domain-containing protein [Butyricimonas faecihominis]
MRILKDTYLSRRFFLILMLGIFAFVMAYVFPLLFIWVAGTLLTVLLLLFVELFELYKRVDGIDALRVVADKLSNGEENPVCLVLRNRYPVSTCLRVIDEIPVEFQNRNVLFRLKVNAGEQREIHYTLRPTKRGSYNFGKILVFVSVRFGLVERRYSFRADQDVAVYPSFMMMHRYELMAYGNYHPENGGIRTRVLGGNMAFEQIKPYVTGDDPRTVNWKATAKYNHLMVNTYTEERSQQIYCLVDKGRTMQSPFNNMTMLDHAINTVLTLSNIILKKGDRAGLITFSNNSRNCVKADNRVGQLNRISEALYRLETHYQETDFEKLYVSVNRQIPTRSLLILFTNFDTVSGLRRHLPALQRLAARHLVLVILFENSELNKALERPVHNLKDAYFETIAAGFATEKRQMVRELSQLGIRVILSKPESLTVNSINSYLNLKERKLI